MRLCRRGWTTNHDSRTVADISGSGKAIEEHPKESQHGRFHAIPRGSDRSREHDTKGGNTE